MITINDVFYFGIYFSLCSFSILCGLGIISFLKIEVTGNKLLFLAPLISLTLLALLLNITILMYIPVSSSYYFIWAVFVLLAIYGVIRNGKYVLERNKWLLVGYILLPLVILVVPYWYGSATKYGDILPDGWNYIAVGQYLWKFPIGVEGGLSPLYQHASTLSSARFTSSAFLALLSSAFRRHDTATGSGIYLAWILFVFIGTCSFFIIDKPLSIRKKALYVLLVVLSGWIWNILWATNYDNLLALVYVPLLIELISNQSYVSKKWAVLIGVVASSLTLIYIEYAGLVFSILLLLLIIRFIQYDPTNRRNLLLFTLIIGAVGITLLLPFSKRVFTFLLAQVSALSGPLVKPGLGMLDGLLKFECIPSAYWAMGCEQQGSWLYVGGATVTNLLLPFKNALAFILSFFTLVGIAGLIKQKKWIDLVPFVVTATAISYMALIQHYSYGAYKVILLLWWFLPYLMLLGIDLIERYFSAHSKIVSFLVYFPIFLLLVNTTFRTAYIALTKPVHLQSDYAQVRNAPVIVENNPILINIDDWLSSEWANYYLRDHDTFLNLRRMYMALSSEVIDRSKEIDLSDVHYVLMEKNLGYSSIKEKVWSGKPYSIWELSPNWILPSDIKNNNGVEIWEGKTGFWLSGEKTTFNILSSYTGTAIITGEFAPGPSIVQGQGVTLRIWNELGFDEKIMLTSKGYLLFKIPVQKGKNLFFLQPVNDLKTAPLQNGDPRTLIASVTNLNFCYDSLDRLLVTRIDNPNGIETLKDKQFFWVSDKLTNIIVFAPYSGWAKISADFSAGPSLPETNQRRILVKSGDYVAQENITPGNQEIRIPVKYGENHIVLQGLDSPTVKNLPNKDTRTLLVGVLNLNIHYEKR